MSLELMGLDGEATKADVQRRYHELAHQAHPDKGGRVEQFHQLKDWRDDALRELKFGHSINQARSMLRELREAARGTICHRCEGSGFGMRRTVGFREFKTICKLCHGKGSL